MPVSQRKTATRPDEREIVDYLVEHVNACQREVVVNYYVALKTKPFVILAGPPGVDKMYLAQGLAEILVGWPSLQWCLFQAYPWWTTRTRAPGHFAMAHAQFNTIKLLDSIEAALAGEAIGLPFFIGIERMSPPEKYVGQADRPLHIEFQEMSQMSFDRRELFDYVHIAWKDVFGHRVRSLLSVGGIAVIVAVFIVLTSVATGLASILVGTEGSARNLALIDRGVVDFCQGNISETAVRHLRRWRELTAVAPMLHTVIQLEGRMTQVRAVPLGNYQTVENITILEGEG